ncbi:MAG: hypothetical protein QW699_01285 [Metallosphaera sp.]|uniref:hypothetical protein n=1 Tax=Metallosphaera sp. TaxID=2020860 RepID=UPI0031678217
MENAIKKIDINAKKMNEFPYYALPEDEVELTFVENNLVPPKVVIKEGKVRLTFVPYESYGELRRAVSSQGEDDLVATFKNGKLIHLEKKRNIFIENKSVDALSEGEVTLNFYPTKFVLFSSVLAMNVRLWENVVKVSTQGEDVIMRVESGKASKQEVIEGNTLSARSKAALFYDYKRKLIFGKEIIDSLASKLL